MTVGRSFLNFFDKTDSEDFGYCQSSDTWHIRETDKNATLTSLTIQKKRAQFIGFDQNLTKSFGCLTTLRSTHFKDKECDGIAFVTLDQKERLLLVELKSKFDTQTLSSAIQQMCFSFLKMHAMLSLCEDYSLDVIAIDFCTATKCAKDPDAQTKIDFFVSQAEESEEQREFGHFFRNLFFKGKVCIRIEKLFQIMGILLPLHNDLKKKEITVYLQRTQTFDDTQASFDYLS
jgi:hypothetical protein